VRDIERILHAELSNHTDECDTQSDESLIACLDRAVKSEVRCVRVLLTSCRSFLPLSAHTFFFFSRYPAVRILTTVSLKSNSCEYKRKKPI
jgi:hypothetical protein